jgi:acyl-CoA thioesterase YciA
MSANASAKLPPSVALPTDQELVLKVIPMPADCNANGDIFGGWVMAQVDLAGSVIPARYTGGRMATVAVNEFIFKQPVRVGDILSFFSKLTVSAAPRSPSRSRCMPSAFDPRASTSR